MKTTILLFWTVFGIFSVANGQAKNGGKADYAPIQGKYLGFAIPKSDDLELLPQLSHKVSENPSANEKELREYKKTLVKTPTVVPEGKTQHKKTRIFEPVVEVGYTALGNQGTPSDNTIAVNKNNQLICIVNSSLRYYSTQTGAGLQGSIGLQNFFSSANIQNGDLQSSNTCDPKVIFDPQAEKFIVFAQTCDGNSSTSQLLVAFSKTDDPTAGWYYYQFSGNPSAQVGTNVWFDYPKIGVSNSDVFICGNLFNNNYNYVQSVCYQINKTKCFAGNTLAAGDALIWYNIPNNPFTMVPMSNGQSGGYGNNMYLLSTLQSFSGTNIGIYEITNSTANNPQLVDQYVNIASAGAPGLGDQQGTSYKLDLGDNRGMDGFYLGGIMHYVFHCNATGNYSGINYTRLKNVSGNWIVINNTKITVPNTDLGFPSIASFGYGITDQSSLIHFNYSSSTNFPGMKVVYVDNNFTVSNPVEVKTGTGYASVGQQGGEVRWGDYSGLSRVQNAPVATAWCFGMYGNTSHNWTNYFAKITSTGWPTNVNEFNQQDTAKSVVTVYPNPLVEDICSISIFLKETGQLDINLLDISGRLVKPIYSTIGIAGDNLFTFNKGALPTGTYFVNIVQNNKLIKNEKISVIH